MQTFEIYPEETEKAYELFREDCLIFKNKPESLVNYVNGLYPTADYYSKVLITKIDYVTDQEYKRVAPFYVDQFKNEFAEYFI